MTVEQIQEVLSGRKQPDVVYIKMSTYDIRECIVRNLTLDGNILRHRNIANWYEDWSRYVGEIENIYTTKPLQLNAVHLSVGSDPELFFVKKNMVVPSTMFGLSKGGDVISDGFQVELNPESSTCRQSAGSFIANALIRANGIAKQNGAELSFKMGHIITEPIWKRASTELKRFGCSPTKNIYEEKFKRSTGLREKFRSAGGHVHFSLHSSQRTDERTEKIVQLMDIIVGNTCVLIDRDPDNARRRKIYGRAGEHRVKSYGLEYRVPSNFWLRSYVLWSMVSALGRNAISIEFEKLGDELISRFDMNKVRDAINNNDFELAKENFLIYANFLKEHNAYGSGISAEIVDKVFTWLTSDNPLSRWETNEAILNNWTTKTRSSGVGFELFIDGLKIK